MPTHGNGEFVGYFLAWFLCVRIKISSSLSGRTPAQEQYILAQPHMKDTQQTKAQPILDEQLFLSRRVEVGREYSVVEMQY